MDSGTLHGISTLFAMVAFLSVCWWAYKPANRKRFEEDGQLALDSDPIYQARAEKTKSGESK